MSIFRFLECYLVQLVKSTNEAIKPATYLLQVHSDKITGYRTAHNNLKETAWSWDISTFYAYRVHKLSVTEIEIIIGKLVMCSLLFAKFKTNFSTANLTNSIVTLIQISNVHSLTNCFAYITSQLSGGAVK